MEKSIATDKELSNLSLEELWVLFPIELTSHNDKWKSWFLKEKKVLNVSLGISSNVCISHIGSTAVNGIWAKPIIDILIQISQDKSMKSVARQLEQVGYILMSESPTRISLNKGYTVNGFADKVFHVHLRYMGDNDELYFRDYLNEHKKEGKEYQELKLELCKKYEHDRDTYTEAKSEFIKKITTLAKKEYSNRYNCLD